jgi:3-phosphoshikimate 1-carboxyvinyltransferase
MNDPAAHDAVVRVGRSGPLRGACSVPGDKSISHRALLFGALCDGPVEIDGLGSGGDNISTARALQALGVAIHREDTRAVVQAAGFEGLNASTAPLDCGNSGTTMRLLCGLLAGRPFVSTLVGDDSLTKRPMARVARPLRDMGARVDGRQDPARPEGLFPPLEVQGAELRGIRYDLPVPSAQLRTALVLAALQAQGTTRIGCPGVARDHTERMLGALGAPVTMHPDGRTVTVDPTGWTGRLRACPMTIPGDLSSAAFILVAAALVPGSDVTVTNVGLNPTRTGVLDVLRAMGADLEVEIKRETMGEPAGDVRVRARPLRATRVAGDLALRALDEIPALAVAAAAAEGTSVFADLQELRVKESDRIASLARELGRAGIGVRETPDGLEVVGVGGAGRLPRGGRVEADSDHRIAMAFAILGLLAEEETVVPAADIATSFPLFADTLRAHGANMVAGGNKT